MNLFAFAYQMSIVRNELNAKDVALNMCVVRLFFLYLRNETCCCWPLQTN
jgi:hypothetical protein